MAKTRLGLALSGGGFRASFFHLGVLRRLAELDLLQFVSTISTVSGGSIVGAHYYLLLKEKYEEKHGRLSRRDYVDLVDQLEGEFVAGNRADLRNCLFRSPVAHLKAMVLGRSYGRRMARLYAKHLYGRVTWRLYRDEEYAGTGVPMHRALVRPPSAPRAASAADNLDFFGSSGYPGDGQAGRTLREVNEEHPEAVEIPRLMVNATCLNTGGPFFFLMNEVGGPLTGYVRTDEVFMLVQYKTLIGELGSSQFSRENYQSAVAAALANGIQLQQEPVLAKLPKTAFAKDFPAHTADHVRFYFAAVERLATGNVAIRDGKWYLAATQNRAIHRLTPEDAWDEARRLLECTHGELRRAKVAAWNLLDHRWRGRGATAEYELELRQALNAIHPGLTARLQPTKGMHDDVATLIVDFYYFRSAENIDWTAPEILAQLTVPEAVAASANFPPVFTPFRIFGLFSTGRYDVVSLTDGGVNDNQGIGAIIDDGCEWLIASDAGGLVEADPDPPDARLPMMDRVINVLMGGLRDLQLQSMHTSAATAGAKPAGKPRDSRKVHFHLTDSLRTEKSEISGDVLARIRTDLDSFNDVEIRFLIQRGYLLANEFVPAALLAKTSPFSKLARPERKHTPSAPRVTDRVRRVLYGSTKRVGKFSEAYPALAAILAGITGLLFMLVERIQRRYVSDAGLWPGEMFALNDAKALVPRSLTNFWRNTTDSLRDESVIALAMLGWIVFLAARGAFRVVQSQRREWLLGRKVGLVVSGFTTLRGVVLRLANVVTVLCVALFLYTVEPVFLLGVLPLWSLPISGAFLIISTFFTPLWRAAGSPAVAATFEDAIVAARRRWSRFGRR